MDTDIWPFRNRMSIHREYRILMSFRVINAFHSLPRAFDATSPSRVKVSNVTIANAALESNALIQARRN